MLTILLGYQTASRLEAPEVLYVGQLPSEARALAAKAVHPRLELVTSPTLVRLRSYQPPVEANIVQGEPIKHSKHNRK